MLRDRYHSLVSCGWRVTRIGRRANDRLVYRENDWTWPRSVLLKLDVYIIYVPRLRATYKSVLDVSACVKSDVRCLRCLCVTSVFQVCIGCRRATSVCVCVTSDIPSDIPSRVMRQFIFRFVSFASFLFFLLMRKRR